MPARSLGYVGVEFLSKENRLAGRPSHQAIAAEPPVTKILLAIGYESCNTLYSSRQSKWKGACSRQHGHIQTGQDDWPQVVRIATLHGPRIHVLETN
jgi:hypothetical protein